MNWLRRLLKSARLKKLLPVIVLAVVILLWFDPLGWNEPSFQPMTLTELQAHLQTHDVTEAQIHSSDLKADIVLADGHKFVVDYPSGYDGDLTNQLLNAHVKQTKAIQRSWFSELMSWLPLLIITILLFVSRTPRFNSGKSKPAERPDTKLADVAGMPEVVDDVMFIVEFLRDSERFRKAGVKPPKGVLLYGPPGTGKTLLARAVAGEAGVPFYAISGADFVEMYVGVGASRVRRFFRSGSPGLLSRLMSNKVAGPRILFIDEIDAVGGHRTGGSGGSREHDQTLTQMLTEMDGFEETNVIVIAATNRPEHLDAALRRPGRFDRQIPVPLPDLRGREEILKVHMRDRQVAPRLELRDVARKTPGFAGADLANLVNEAAKTMLARLGKEQEVDELTFEDFQNALTTILVGPARKSAEVLEHDRKITGAHEAGHVITSMAQPEIPDPTQVSVIPRGLAGGITLTTPGDEQLKRRSQFRAELVGMLGGRAAEIITLEGDFTQGASNDLEKATALALAYVSEYGLHDSMLSCFEQERWSDNRCMKVEAAVEQLLRTAQERAIALIRQHQSVFEQLVDDLIANETVTGERLQDHYRPLLDAATNHQGESVAVL